MKSNTWMASGLAARQGLWLGLFLACSTVWAQQAPAPPPPTDPENIESMFSISASYWRTTGGQASIRGGKTNADPAAAALDFPKLKPTSYTAQITFPTGGFNRFEIGYFHVGGNGSFQPANDGSLQGATINAGENVSTNFKLTSVRVAWNYLSFPIPPLDSRLRVKTFWEVQFTNIHSTITFPDQEDTDTGYIPSITPKKKIFYPGVGVGLEYVVSNKFRFESRVSGMAWPGHSRYVDAEASVVGRLGSVEIFGGAKLFNFRTATNSDFFMKGTIWGPQGGIRYVFPKFTPR